MTLRRLFAALALALIAPGASFAANYTTANFVVTAPDEALAKRFGDMAEYYRKEKAEQWLGQEMPRWPQRCPLRVRIAESGAGGETSFTFSGDANRGVVASQQMYIFGPVRQLLNSVLPHEVTHTVFAYHFGRPVPRWADEGGSVLSENDEERTNHDIKCREILNQGKAFRLSALFRMVNYPRDMLILYAEGFSVSDYLVRRGGDGREGRRKFLQFLAHGMQNSNENSHGTVETWNAAAQRVYGVETSEALEAQWIEFLKNPGARVAARNTGNGNRPVNMTAVATPTSGSGVGFTSAGRTELRSSAAPALPILEPPVKAARGTMPDADVRPATRTAVRPNIPDRPPPILLPPEIPRPVK
ncbi:MAG TPA: hypothetical protein VN641_11685 [Urbifossiella sp.]|nr:hypothetical protein [Urbifossiella sp.]